MVEEGGTNRKLGDRSATGIRGHRNSSAFTSGAGRPVCVDIFSYELAVR
jgi:hypothetical protein